MRTVTQFNILLLNPFNRDKSNKWFNSYFSYDIEENMWETMRPQNIGRSHASAAFSNGYIFLVGGFNRSAKKGKTTEIYDPFIDEWTKSRALNVPRSSFALVEANGYLYAMGDDTVEVFNPCENDNWERVCETNIQR